ncbi:MAG: hypothetical protein DRJ21_00090 [Candidatus Methanomethylicota archaeon]|uniref:HTH arsR-type domain-containing protein n=1 Tax=Thermoproteota archaeon TaxID=2056631 RepID=A0A497EXN6_9CREN|nr:MAG: hypothetical protein DRJ21_00090 [Candidatus Verstraetearchaeota archaeon]
MIKIMMKIKVIKRLTPEDLIRIERRLERKMGMTFEEFEEEFTKSRKWKDLLRLYLEWAKVHHAYKAYEEEGEVDLIQKRVLNISINELLKIITMKKIEILNEIAKGVDSISDLARKVNRDITNVYRDLKILEKYGIIRLERDGKKLKPRILVKQIILEFL